MKKILFCALSVFCSSMGEANACSNDTLGTLRINNNTVDCISNTGTVFLNSVIVNHKVNIVGELEANNSTMNDLDAVGNVIFKENSNVKGDVNITGKLTASNTKFEKKIVITSSKIEFKEGSNVSSVYVRKNNGNKYTEYLYLNNSIVNGDIIFESGRGKVVLTNGGRIIGTLTGGTMINR